MESEIYISDNFIIRLDLSESEDAVLMNIESRSCDLEQELTPESAIELGQYLVDLGSSLL